MFETTFISKNFLMGGGRFVLTAFLMTALLAGCNAFKGFGIDETHNADDPPSISNISSIKDKLGITTTGAQGVRDTFTAVHDYVSSKTAAELASEGFIQLGDWIDLESLAIAGYPSDNNDAQYGKLMATANQPIPGGDDRGMLLRLIVVGINSFNEGQDGTYTGNGNGTDAHLVFQFQNAPAWHRMDKDSGIGASTSYIDSELRKYLVPTSAANSGNFQRGLLAAGVPFDAGWIWGPRRYLGGDIRFSTEIADRLWLPTEREMTGANIFSKSSAETAENQAHLLYYNDHARLVKHNKSGDSRYWLASNSSSSSNNYCTVGASFTGNGAAISTMEKSAVLGVAPAFCVK